MISKNPWWIQYNSMFGEAPIDLVEILSEFNTSEDFEKYFSDLLGLEYLLNSKKISVYDAAEKVRRIRKNNES